MKKIEFKMVKEKIQDSDISEFEYKYDIILPENYKKLIKKYNGGLVDGLEDLRKLRSLKYGIRTLEDFINSHQNIENNISKNLLSFASDISDNPICINIKPDDEDYGKIYIIYFDCGSLEPVLMADSLEKLFDVEKIEHL